MRSTLLFLGAFVTLATAWTQPALITRVEQRAIELATSDPVYIALNNGDNSWIRGTLLEAVTELHYPRYSAYGRQPNATHSRQHARPEPICTQVDELLQDRLERLSIAAGNATVLTPERRLFKTGTPGDPLAIGTGVLLCSHWASINRSIYTEAANTQLNIALYEDRRIGQYITQQPDGGCWSDQGYMLPPFLSYAGLYKANKTIMLEGAIQSRLEYDILFNATFGVLKHIVGPGYQELGLWTTGNAWWAAGATRVIALLASSPWKEEADVLNERANLTALAQGVVEHSYQHLNATDGLIENYQILWDFYPHTFGDAAGTALLAAAAYRLAVFDPDWFDKPALPQLIQAFPGADVTYENGTRFPRADDNATVPSTTSFASVTVSSTETSLNSTTSATSVTGNSTVTSLSSSQTASVASETSISASASSTDDSDAMLRRAMADKSIDAIVPNVTVSTEGSDGATLQLSVTVSGVESTSTTQIASSTSTVSPSPSSISTTGLTIREVTENLRRAVFRFVNEDGYLTHAVDPLSWTVMINSTSHTPEGNSFVLLLYSAHRDWLDSQGR